MKTENKRKQNPASIKANCRTSAADLIGLLKSIADDEVPPGHNSPFKLYFNGKLIASASEINLIKNNKPTNHEN
jgi:hypothetical protein